MISARTTVLLFAGALLVACGPQAPATTAPPSPPIDALMHCPTPDATVTDLPPSAPDGARTLDVPAVFRKSLRYIRTLPPGAQKPCDGIDPKRVVADKGKGNARWALLGKVVEPLPLWRAFAAGGKVRCGDESFDQAALQGSWWSAEDPRKSGKDAYQRGVAVCSLWNDMGKVVRCTVKPGAIVAIGPTQSVESCKCPVPPKKAPESYEATDQWQVYVNLYGQRMSDIMECEEPVSW